MRQRVLIAFDKFKGAIPAESACSLVRRTILDMHPDWVVETAPITDGGDGFCPILTNAARGTFTSFTVAGPRMTPLRAPIGWVDAAGLNVATRVRLGLHGPGVSEDFKIAVIEMASASGLAQLATIERDPWQATTLGTGQLLLSATQSAADLIVLGVGGSATSDLGLGALSALGYSFEDVAGNTIQPPAPAAWPRISRVRGNLVHGFPPVRIACDVGNPLLGPTGAAAVFGPQKGLRGSDLARHESLAARMAELLCAHRKVDATRASLTPGAGASGGLPFGLIVAAEAKIIPGFDLVSAWLDLERKIDEADVVVTGEGRFDATSMHGKGPGSIVRRALERRKQTIVFAGSIDDSLCTGAKIVAITPSGTPLETALTDTEANLARAVVACFG